MRARQANPGEMWLRIEEYVWVGSGLHDREHPASCVPSQPAME